MDDITPRFNTPSAAAEITLPSPFSADNTAQTVGGFMASPSSLTAGNVTYNSVGEQILIGQATASLTGIGVFIGNAGDGTYDFRAGDPAGNYIQWDASTAILTIKGTITATAGTIGGFTIAADNIQDAANSFGLASTVTGGDDVRFWAGAAFASRATAPFRVTEAGVVVANTITATGTINAQGGYLGAPTTVLNISTSGLDVGTTGRIQGGQSAYNTGVGFFLGYSGAAYKFSVGDPTGSYITWDGAALTISGVQQIIKNFTAGQALTQGQACVIALTGNGSTLAITQTTGANGLIFNQDTSSGFQAVAQAFLSGTDVIKITTVSVRLAYNSGTPTGVFNVFIASSLGGTPIGSTDTHLNSTGITASFVDYTFTLNADLLPGQTYYMHVTWGRTSGNGSGSIKVAYATGNPYASGNTSTLDGFGAWTGNSPAADADLYFTINQTKSVAGRVYRSSAVVAAYSNPFIGFVFATTASGGSVPVVISGSAIGLSALSTGSQYYLADTIGTIGTSAGTVTRKVGIALSTTELLITNIW